MSMGTCTECLLGADTIPTPRNPLDADWKDRYTEQLETKFDAAVEYLNTDSSAVLVVDGPMSCGKSGMILALAEEMQAEGLDVMYSRSYVDTRTISIWSRNHAKHNGVSWKFEEVDDDVLYQPDVLVIDETHFVGLRQGEEFYLKKLIEVIQARRELGKRTIVAMLDENFLCQKWPAYQAIIQEIAQNGGREMKLKAVCMECGSPASHTHRKTSEQGAIQIGGDDSYEALCDCCHPEVHKGDVVEL